MKRTVNRIEDLWYYLKYLCLVVECEGLIVDLCTYQKVKAY